MAATRTGWLLNSFRSTYKQIAGLNNIYPSTFIPTRDYAARKGTRERREKLKKKNKTKLQKVEKIGFIPQNLRKKKKEVKVSLVLKTDIFDDWKKQPTDDVWNGSIYAQKVYSFEEAIRCHREAHDATIYNSPDSLISAFIELDLQGNKPTKFVDTFTRVAQIPHKFDHGEERKILAFSKTPQIQEMAKKAGATGVGGRELVKQIQGGEFILRDYDHIVAHTDIIPDLLLIRGILKKKFPAARTGTLSDNIKLVVERFRHGIKYTARPSEHQKDYGKIEAIFGKLNMDVEQLEENFAALLQDIESVRPKREGPFVMRAQIRSPISAENFKVGYEKYLESSVKSEAEEEEEDNTHAIIATN